MAWLRTQESPAQAWHACERGDWLIWISAHLLMSDAGRRLVVSVTCDCAETAPARSPEAIRCTEVVRAWTRGEATIDEVHAVGADLVAGWDACAAAYAAAAAADAAAAARATAAAADAAADAAAYAAADAAAYAAAYTAHLRTLANLVRDRIPWATVESAAETLMKEKM